MHPNTIQLIKQLQRRRRSKVLVFVTGDRPGMETQIAQDCLGLFVQHLDAMGPASKISLYLYSRGGETLAGWSVVNLIRQFCDRLEVIIPFKAHSTATLICLGADVIIMTKQASLGPIDPSVNTPLNPEIPGVPPPRNRMPVSVEAVNGFIDLARERLAIEGSDNLAAILAKLADMVHPLVLGNAYRAQSQIRMLARKLLAKRKKGTGPREKAEKIISFLCSESGSHDYTIDRREARDDLGLPIERPDDALYHLIKGMYTEIEKELELNSRYDPQTVLGADSEKEYSLRRCIIESERGGEDVFVSEGRLTRQQLQVPGLVGPQMAIHDARTFEGWRHENAGH